MTDWQRGIKLVMRWEGLAIGLVMLLGVLQGRMFAAVGIDSPPPPQEELPPQPPPPQEELPPAPALTSVWLPYGFAVPDDPLYNFRLPSNLAKPMLGLAAKGNIVIGDYTAPGFQASVLPMVQPYSLSHPDGKTQAYAVDPTDRSLGYVTDHDHGQPTFDGDYTQEDRGRKLDHSPRHFYESSLPDTQFQALINGWTGAGNTGIGAVLFTNHAVMGYVRPGAQHRFSIDGALVARDDAIAHSDTFRIIHDNRLLSPQMANRILLPLSIQRPSIVAWQECPPGSECRP